MIRECNVLNYNPHQNIVVVDFEGVQVQLPCLKRVDKKCFISYEDGVYTLSSKEDYKKFKKPIKKPNVDKKTEGIIEDIVV